MGTHEWVVRTSIVQGFGRIGIGRKHDLGTDMVLHVLSHTRQCMRYKSI